MSASVTDPLAEVLALVRPQAALAAELHAHGRWSLAFDAYAGVKFGVVVEGECLIWLRGRAAQTLGAGDVFLLGKPSPYYLGSDKRTPSRNGNELLRRNTPGIARIGRERDQPEVRVIGGLFVLSPTNDHLLVDALPPLVRIPAREAGALRGVTQLLVDEAQSAQLGRSRTLDQLGQLLLTYALRWLDAGGHSPARAGWLRALADPRVGAALRVIHSSVEKGTSLTELARVAGLSRTAFAARFKALVGQPPLTYAIAWRMSLAKDALCTTDRAVGELAFALGYASESAFSLAFRRVVGCSPRAYRKK